jgi:hypothetical protein
VFAPEGRGGRGLTQQNGAGFLGVHAGEFWQAISVFNLISKILKPQAERRRS